MDKYIEISIAKKLTPKDRILSFVLPLLPILVSSYILVVVMSLRLTLLLASAVIICAVSLYVSYRIYMSFNIDWEYILVDDEIRFTKIINKTKRKEMITVNLQKTEAVARVDDREHNQYLNNPSYKKYIFSSNTGRQCWFIAAATSNGQRTCIVFEPDDRMLDTIRLTVKSKFYK